MPTKPLAPAALYRRCDPEGFEFETTADLEDLTEFIGQSRAVDAVRFGIGIRRSGYNLFALGAAGTGKHSLVRRYVEEQAVTEAVPADWCYVNNFEQEHKPRVLRLPAGMGVELCRDREVRSASLGVEALNMGRIEQELRVLARRAKRTLAEHANRHGATWSFRVWRGSIEHDLLAATLDADVLALARLGAMLTPRDAAQADRPGIAVLFSGSEAARRALTTATGV